MLNIKKGSSLVNALSSDPTKINILKYPSNEINLYVEEVLYAHVYIIELVFSDIVDITSLQLLVFHLRTINPSCDIHLLCKYLPFARDDKAQNGRVFTFKWFAEMLNNMALASVTCHDPHSEVNMALLNQCIVVRQIDTVGVFLPNEPFTLICPDLGASKKINALSTHTNCMSVVRFSKVRDPKTGNITHTEMIDKDISFYNETCIIVDDICDGGRTFIEIAKLIKEKDSTAKLQLFVTHGLFTQGTQELRKYFDKIVTKDGVYND